VRRKITDERKRAFAQAMRDNPTEAEELLRRALWFAGLRPMRQKIVKGYIVDFYFAKAKLIVEVDGHHHFTAKGRTADRIRTGVLTREGYQVMRFSNSKVIYDAEGCARLISARLAKIM
jgi:very-short-patch-repair endonuclease